MNFLAKTPKFEFKTNQFQNYSYHDEKFLGKFPQNIFNSIPAQAQLQISRKFSRQSKRESISYSSFRETCEVRETKGKRDEEAYRIWG